MRGFYAMSFAFVGNGTRFLLIFALVVLSEEKEEPNKTDNRITHGFETTIEECPFQLALEGGGRQICGGTILSMNWALTAAHCIYNQPLKWLTFRSGSSTRGRGGTVHRVHFYLYHELYRRDTLDYDVAVVRVREPFVYGSTVQPVSLPTLVPRAKENVTVSGWGYLEDENLRKPTTLMAANISVFDWDDCKKPYPGLTPRMLCAGDEDKDFCNGDSGGPLIRGGREQVGIVSWSYKCGEGLPGVYTNVSALATWIRSQASLDRDFIFPEN